MSSSVPWLPPLPSSSSAASTSRTLLDLSSLVVSRSHSWFDLESRCPGPLLPLPVIESYVFHAFVDDDHLILPLWSGEGQFDPEDWEVSDPIQLGMTLLGKVRSRNENLIATTPWVNVKVTFERQALTSVSCGCGWLGPFLCGHVVALTLFRGRHPHLVPLRAPISETLGRLGRCELQQLVQELLLLRDNDPSSSVLMRDVATLAEGISKGPKSTGAVDVSISSNGDEDSSSLVLDPLEGVNDLLQESQCVSKSSPFKFLVSKVMALLRNNKNTALRLLELLHRTLKNRLRCCRMGECPRGEQVSDLAVTFLQDKCSKDSLSSARCVWRDSLMGNDVSAVKSAREVSDLLRGGVQLDLRWGARVAAVLPPPEAIEVIKRSFMNWSQADSTSSEEILMRGEDLLVAMATKVFLEHHSEDILEELIEWIPSRSLTFFELGRFLLAQVSNKKKCVLRVLKLLGNYYSPSSSSSLLLEPRWVRLLEDVVTEILLTSDLDDCAVPELQVVLGGFSNTVTVLGVCRRLLTLAQDDRSSLLLIRCLGLWLLKRTLKASSSDRFRGDVVAIVLCLMTVAGETAAELLLEQWEELFTPEELVGVVATKINSMNSEGAKDKVRNVAREMIITQHFEASPPSLQLSSLLLLLGDDDGMLEEETLLLLSDKSLSDEVVCFLRLRNKIML